MSDTTLRIFKRIVLRNKLLSAEELDKLLAKQPKPELAIKHLVDQGVLPEKTAQQVLALYRAKVDEALADFAAFDETDEEPDEGGAPSAPAKGPAVRPKKKRPAATAEVAREAARRVAARPSTEADKENRRIVHSLLRQAQEAGASDLHFKSDMVPVMRRVGELRDLPVGELSAEKCEQLLLSILDGEQRNEFLEKNDLDFCYDGGKELGRFRTSYLREYRGVNGVFRPIPSKVPTFEELNLPLQVRKFVDYPVGVVLVTGPKGCGKTTTLAAMVDLINSTRRVHIITVEDPIEFIHPCKLAHVNQRQVGRDTKSFSNALRSALREAPDVIMVGEMRDLETTSLAVTAAETGHLVLATLHTPDALRTIGRILDVFPPKEQPQIRAMISESLRGVASQLLIPNVDGTSMELAVEVLVNTPAIGHLIREDRVFQIPGIMQTGKKLGMVLMDDSLIRLVREGRISREAALARASDIGKMEKQLE